MYQYKVQIFTLIFSLLLVTPLHAQNSMLPDGTNSDRVLRIGTKVTPPLVIKTPGGEWEGISIELWKEIARNLGLRYEFIEMPLSDLLRAMETSQLDAVVGALSITADREKRFDFSQPFFFTGLTIAVRNQDSGAFFSLLGAILSKSFLKAIGVLLFLLLLSGTIIWLFEHRSNSEQFDRHPVKGIGSGFWISAVTMTTVGYGDKAPKTLGGRIVVLIWMFASIIFISSLTAAITSALTVERLGSRIQNPSDLAYVRTATVADSVSAGWLQENNLPFAEFKQLQDALTAVDEGRYDAVVYDEPLLRYLILNDFPRLRVLPITFARQNYGIAFPTESVLRESCNRVLLEKTRQAEWESLLKKYLGS